MIEQIAQRRFAIDDAVVVETALVAARWFLNMDARFGAHLPPTIQTAHAKTGRPTTVGHTDFEVRAGIENAAVNQRGHEQGIFYGDADAVGNAVFVCAIQDQIIAGLRVKKQQSPHRFGRYEQGQTLGIVPSAVIDHHVEFRSLEAEVIDGVIQDVDGRVDGLSRQSGEADKAVRPLAGHPGDLLVKIPSQQTALIRRQMVAENRGVNGHHLQVDTLRIHVF